MPTLNELMKPEKESFNKKFVKTSFRWRGKDYPLMQYQTIQSLASNILNHNKRGEYGYTSVLFSGKSMSGKSNDTQALVHKLACENKERTYVIKHYKGSHIHRLDEILASLERGVNYILVWQDVSYELKLIKEPHKREKLASAMTTIRHQVKANVIDIKQIHYLTALSPMMRDADFRIITSLSDQDLKNWGNILGKHNIPTLRKYQRQYASQMNDGYFFVNNPSEPKPYRYNTDEPFRIKLCSELIGLHPLLVAKEGCKACSPPDKLPKKKGNSEAFVKEFINAYTTRAKTAFEDWAYFKFGIRDALPANKYRAIQFCENYYAGYDMDIQEILNIFHNGKKKRKRLPKMNQSLLKETTEKILKQSNTEENEVKNDETT